MAAPARKVLTGARVVLPSGTVDDGELVIDGAHIGGSAPSAGQEPEAERWDLSGHWIVPGFVDLHNHGGGGASFTSGTVDDVLTGIATHRAHGTTTLVASTVTGEMEFLTARAGLLSELTEQGDLAGIHFEGPFISPCRKGAHSEALLRDPHPADVAALLDASRGAARMVTLATELPGGLDSVRLLADRGVIAAVGHTDATYEQTVEAIDAGATVATHLFNAMPPLGHRAPGPIAALLEDERVTVELINDGTHLHPAALELAFHRAGADRVAFITDAMDAAGFGDGRYLLGPLEVDVVDGVARLVEGARSPVRPSLWTGPSGVPRWSTSSRSARSCGPSPPTLPGCSGSTIASGRWSPARTRISSFSTRGSRSRGFCGAGTGLLLRRWLLRPDPLGVAAPRPGMPIAARTGH